MKITNLLIKLLCVLLCVTFLLVGCGKQNEETPNEPPVSSPSSSKEETSSDVYTEEPSRYDDLFIEMNDFGTSAVGFGDLAKDEYKETLAELETVLDKYSRNVSVVAYALDNNKALAYNTSEELFCACTVKAAYALYACKEMEKGNGSLSTTMTYESKHYEPGTGDMQYSGFGTIFSMETIIDKTMGISDNVGYLMMVDYFGRDGYNEWISQLGCPSLQIRPTVWSLRAKAKELAVIWREIYEYFKTDSEYAKFLKKTCTNTPNNYATAALEGVDISHKQGHNSSGGWLAYSDAGIVWKGDKPYIIVVLTDAPGPSSYDAGVMADIIKIIDKKLF